MFLDLRNKRVVGIVFLALCNPYGVKRWQAIKHARKKKHEARVLTNFKAVYINMKDEVWVGAGDWAIRAGTSKNTEYCEEVERSRVLAWGARRGSRKKSADERGPSAMNGRFMRKG